MFKKTDAKKVLKKIKNGTYRKEIEGSVKKLVKDASREVKRLNSKIPVKVTISR